MTGRRARKGARCGKETLGGDGGQKTRSLKCRSQIEKRGRTCHEQMWTFKGMAFFLPTMILQEETLLIRTEDPTHKNPFVLLWMRRQRGVVRETSTQHSNYSTAGAETRNKIFSSVCSFPPSIL